MRISNSCGVKNVTLTGGEPLIQPEIEWLITLLSADKALRVEIETNGSVDIAGYDARPENVCMTLDYKLPDSGMEQFMRTENYAWLKPQDAVKFVVSSIRDLETAKKIIETYDLCAKATVYLSSAFSAITPAQIVEYMIQEKHEGCPVTATECTNTSGSGEKRSIRWQSIKEAIKEHIRRDF